MQEFVGKLEVQDSRIGIVVSRFNELITRKLLEGALEGLSRLQIPTAQVTVAWVPGACEIPLTAKKLALLGSFDAIICLGAVIRGATAHFDYVASIAANGITQVALETQMPVIFGVLTLDTMEQGLERTGEKMGNKGFEAAMTAAEMIHLLRQLTP